MFRFVVFSTALAVWIAVLASTAGAQKPPAPKPPAAAHEHDDHDHDHDEGWTIPEGADKMASPLTVNASVVAAGQKLFMNKCQKCHGKLGKGDGVDADPKHKKDMDLTNPARVDKNPDGVVFYRIWNG